MTTTLDFSSIPTEAQPLAACSECQKGRCCGHCWCCYDKDRHDSPQMSVIMTLQAVCGDVGCDWLSSHGNDNETDLTEVCGGSGWYHRPHAAD